MIGNGSALHIDTRFFNSLLGENVVMHVILIAHS